MNPSIKWYRSDDGVLAGVCKGLSEALELEVGLIRMGFILFTIFGGSGLLLYFGLALSLPRKDRLSLAYDSKVLGVCAKLARRLEIEVGLVRFLMLMSAVISFGLTILIYFVLYFILPNETRSSHSVKDINS
ncbi:MAG: PspC domain-containing protein [Bdellovibrionales bacterium]|nr:PspC domain-containing protein [Bdellovibrionales bacterium]